MMTFIITFSMTFSLLLATVVLISYCKRRQNRTSHGLTGMCHESGDTMCGCCSSRLLGRAPKNLSRPNPPESV